MNRSDHEAAITELHAWYCERTGLQTKFFFSQRLWHDRLRDYNYDAAALRADAELIVRYLKREVARDKRNIGSLKLINFLQPDNFDADLAIARLTVKNRKQTSNVERRTSNAEQTQQGEWRGTETAAKLKEFRKSLGGG